MNWWEFIKQAAIVACFLLATGLSVLATAILFPEQVKHYLPIAGVASLVGVLVLTMIFDDPIDGDDGP